MLLHPQHDAMGTAIRDFFEKGNAQPIIVSSSMFDDDEMPVETLFRDFAAMSASEQRALNLARGYTLDVGAGAGCHSLVLQSRNIHTTAIDISPLAVETMRRRGIDNAFCADFFDWTPQHQFDTILMLMNGTGIAGTLNRLPLLFERLNELLAPGGQLLIDSSDLRYIFEDEDGTFDPDEFDHYYGEVDYRMSYGKIRSKKFDWLYADFNTLKQCANQKGYNAEIICEGSNYDYLARITKS